MEQGKIFSILGDSVSTFEGYTPSKAVFFDRYIAGETGVETVWDTWWMQVIHHFGGSLGVNHSLAGSLVAGNNASAGTAMNRIEALGVNGHPDVILVAMGCNDWGFGVLPSEFEEAYTTMAQRLVGAYPDSAIWCATLPEGREVAPVDRFFFNVDGRISGKVYSDAIRRVAGSCGLQVADLASYGPYDSIDGVHPNREGMRMLADAWIHELAGDSPKT